MCTSCSLTKFVCDSFFMIATSRCTLSSALQNTILPSTFLNSRLRFRNDFLRIFSACMTDARETDHERAVPSYETSTRQRSGATDRASQTYIFIAFPVLTVIHFRERTFAQHREHCVVVHATRHAFVVLLDSDHVGLDHSRLGVHGSESLLLLLRGQLVQTPN